MVSKSPEAHRWGLGLKDDELRLINDGSTEIDLNRSRMPLLSDGDQIKLVDWNTEQECSAEVLKRLATCHYRVKITGNFEPIRKNPTSPEMNGGSIDQGFESRKMAS